MSRRSRTVTHEATGVDVDHTRTVHRTVTPDGERTETVDLRPFWQTQHPDQDSDRQRLQRAALQFTTTAEGERGLLMKRHLPEVYEQLPAQVRLEIETYEKRRAAKVELGAWRPPPPDATALDELRAAAQIAATEPPVPKAVEVAGRRAFQEAVSAGSFSAMVEAFRAWGAAVQEASSAASAYRAARALLGFYVHEPLHAEFVRPRFSDELDRVFGHSPRPAAMLPDDLE